MNTKKNKSAVIYTTQTCKYCHLVEDFFKENGVEYQKFDVGTDLAKRREMVEKSGQMGVPVIEIGGKIVVGWDEEVLKELVGV